MKTYQRLVVKQVREAVPELYNATFSTSEEAARFARQLIGEADRETFLAFHLNVKHKLHCVDYVSVGSLNASIVHPREVLKAALLTNTAALIFAHNHPSGDPRPSREDIDITRRLREAAELFGIRVLDHVVIGDTGRWVSMMDDGYL